MEWYLIILGVICLAGGLIMEHPVFNAKVTQPLADKHWLQEEARVKLVKQQVEKAREDVAVLLTELDRASERVVEQMTSWAEQAQTAPSKLPLETTTEQKAQPVAPSEIATARTKQELAGVPSSQAKDDVKNKYQTVFRLAEEGFRIDDIAQIAKIGKGEVQLLLELKNRGE